MTFQQASAVADFGDNLWRAELAENWDIMGNTHGGYMQAIAARASSRSVGGRDPVAITGHFTSPGHTGPVEVETKVVRNGRRFSVVRAQMRQDERVILETLGTYADPLDSEPEVILNDGEPPILPPPDECIRAEPVDGASFPPPLMAQIDLRIEPTSAGAILGDPSGEALIEGWVRLKDDEAFDPFALIFVSDAFPPTTFAADLPVGWTPTLELNVHIRFPCPNGWIRCQFRSRFVSGGLIEEDGLLWDENDRLVAQSRQLALVSHG